MSIVFATIVLLFACKHTAQPNDKLPVSILAVPVTNGWGYEIYVDNKIFIKQDFIPAVSGRHSFVNKEQALVAANLVFTKMKEGKNPALNKSELQQAGIIINN